MKHRIVIDNSGEHYPCGDETHLLQAMEVLGRKGIPVGCRNGGCGVCRIRICKGEYALRKMSRAVVSAQDERGGLVLACKTYPRSDMRVQVVGKMVRGFERATTGTVFGFDFAPLAAPSQPGAEDSRQSTDKEH
jgi:ferredoxin